MQFADDMQQEFSYEGDSTLFSAIPTLEHLHTAWYSRSQRAKYAPFKQALTAAAEKIDEYYNKSATSHAYTFAMSESPQNLYI